MSLPFFDKKEQKIVDAIKDLGGDVFRTDLKRKIGGSNTTFIRKIASLKKKGIIDEYKRKDERLKTAYKFTRHAQTIFDIHDMLSMEKWFSASQKIELFPELERIAQLVIGDGLDIYGMLGIQPLHMSLEASLATNTPPTVKEEEVREILSMINAFLQNIVTKRLNPGLDKEMEGYIIFRYRLEKPEEELQRMLPKYLMDYVKAIDPLEQHRAMSSLVEISIRHINLLPMMTVAASNVAHSLKLESELQILLERYKSYKEGEEPMQLTRIQLMVSALQIFKKLYDQQRRGIEGKQ